MNDPQSNGHSRPPEAQGPEITHGQMPVDPGNQLLSIVPSALTGSVQQTPLGQRAAATVRTVDTTLTVFLAKDEVDTWIDVLTQVRGQMSGIILPGG